MMVRFQNLLLWLLLCHVFMFGPHKFANARRGCSDELPHYCKRLKAYLGPFVCRTTIPGLRKLVTTKCLKTCGFCRHMYPIHCSYSLWGCCWDGLTPKDDPYGFTCPKCQDRFPHTCRQFAYYCRRPRSFSGGFLIMACPVTCFRCVPSVNLGHSKRTN